MTWIERFLSSLEARLRDLIEGDGAADGFPSPLHRQLSGLLSHALKQGARPLSDPASPSSMVRTAPDQYTLVMPGVLAQALLTHPTELDRLARLLVATASRAGLTFISPPIVRVVADPRAQQVSVEADFSQRGLQDSNTYQLQSPASSAGLPASGKLPSAYLIINGLSTFLIKSPVINIGRDPSNQLQLEDPNISPRHAQLRFVQGRFVIFDLDSPRGTFVNGVAVSSHALTPGDVIRLAYLPLVFGQDAPQAGGYTQELPAAPPPPQML